MLNVCNQQAISNSSVDFNYLRQLVREHSAVALDAGKEYLAELHLENLVKQLGLGSIGALVEHLKVMPFGDLHLQAIESLVNYETTFFRDIYPFDALRDYILPEILKRRAKGEKIKIWSAACSSGQEPYSIAMLIRENFPELDQLSVQIIASDFSNKVLARAQEGLYTQLEVQRGLPTNLRKKYFHSRGRSWRIDEEVRNMIDFRQINLIESWSLLPKKVDVILLRNVLIYFNIETKKNILCKVRQVLEPDGYLVLGAGETTFNLDNKFERVQLGKAICYKVKCV